MSINLQVNMPLLRLLNQITNMYQNVKDTQTELREQQPHQYVSRNHAKPPTSQSGIFICTFTLFKLCLKHEYFRSIRSTSTYSTTN